MSMRIDWENEVRYKGITYYVHADYEWDYDNYGKRMVVVTKVRAYREDNDIEAHMDDFFMDYVADIIQDEFEDVA